MNLHLYLRVQGLKSMLLFSLLSYVAFNMILSPIGILMLCIIIIIH